MLSRVSEPLGRDTDVAVFESDADSCQSGRNPLCSVIDLIEAGSFAGKSSCDFVDKTSTC